jgi:hypothetical protein
LPVDAVPGNFDHAEIEIEVTAGRGRERDSEKPAGPLGMSGDHRQIIRETPRLTVMY